MLHLRLHTSGEMIFCIYGHDEFQKPYFELSALTPTQRFARHRGFVVGGAFDPAQAKHG